MEESENLLDEEENKNKESYAEKYKWLFSLGNYYLINLQSRTNFVHYLTNCLELLQLFHFIFTSTAYYQLSQSTISYIISIISDGITLYPFITLAPSFVQIAS